MCTISLYGDEVRLPGAKFYTHCFMYTFFMFLEIALGLSHMDGNAI